MIRGYEAGWDHRRGGLRMQLEGPTAAGLMYSTTGSDGPVVVLLHGVLMNGTLWDTVVGRACGIATAASSRNCRSARTPRRCPTTPTSPCRRSPP